MLPASGIGLRTQHFQEPRAFLSGERLWGHFQRGFTEGEDLVWAAPSHGFPTKRKAKEKATMAVHQRAMQASTSLCSLTELMWAGSHPHSTSQLPCLPATADCAPNCEQKLGTPLLSRFYKYSTTSVAARDCFRDPHGYQSPSEAQGPSKMAH